MLLLDALFLISCNVFYGDASLSTVYAESVYAGPETESELSQLGYVSKQ